MTQTFNVGEIWSFLLAFAFQNSRPNAQIWTFWAKKYQLANLNEISPVSFFEGADFKSDIGFRKFWRQSPNMGVLGQNV